MLGKKITDIITKDALAEFQYFRDGVLYYKIGDFVFQVPLSDTGTAVFNRTDKAIFFMRWVRKFLEQLNQDATPTTPAK